MAEFLGFRVDAPEFVRARNEFSLLVPALHPSNAVVELEETDFELLAMVIVDFAVLLAQFVIRDQKVFLENPGVADGDRTSHLDKVALMNGVNGRDGTAFSGFRGRIVGWSIFVGGNEVPSSAWDIFVKSWHWRFPVLCFPNWALAPRFGKPFVWREERLSSEEEIWCHSRGQTEEKYNTTENKKAQRAKGVSRVKSKVGVGGDLLWGDGLCRKSTVEAKRVKGVETNCAGAR